MKPPPNNSAVESVDSCNGNKPLVAITMGDPGGVGAEVVVKALADPEIRKLGRFIVYGLEEMLLYAADQAEIAPYWFRVPHDEIEEVRSGVVVADFDELPATFSKCATPEGGAASKQFLDAAVAANKAGFVNAIVTAPINKTSWKMARVRFPGHTEYLADAYRCRRVTMAFVGGPLRVALASTHVGLFHLRNSFTIGRVFQPIDLLDDWLRRFMGTEQPRIAVCGLNPHASEDGQFGDEERRIIEPAMVMAGELGIQVEGPFPADTLFIEAAKGKYDGVVAMYHDQGLIPVKLLHFDSAVNVSLGLPVIRTSVDHGTAYDIAGKNKANPGSMKAALKLACSLATAPTLAVPKRSNAKSPSTSSTTKVDPAKLN
ncbi:MAG: 4-hydroxythreonine-4-phosphate dehydrogenase [Phycisphaerae bacterium]|nr:MAG: 4-hydroxythreonine-4-phosphate dehydrogenase [Phycisphaerae bacterium]